MANTPTDPKNPTEFLKDLLKIESVSGNEAEIATYLRSFLKHYNIKTLDSEVGNVVGIIGQGSPVLLLASHMDTVSTDNPYREDGDKIYATGAVDTKPSLAAMFYAAVTGWTPENGTLIIAGIVQEENAIIGIENLFDGLKQADITPDYAIFGEPTKQNRICLGYRGRVCVGVQAKAETGHCAAAWEYDNIIELVMKGYSQVQKIAEDYNSKVTEKGRFYEMTPTLSVIHAGKETNTLPTSCNADVDIRIPLGVSASDLAKQIEKTFEDIVATDAKSSKTSISVTFPSCFNACSVLPTTPVVNALRWAAFKVLGKKIVMLKKTGSTFTNLIQAHYISENPNFACITYGPGDPRLEHTNNEFISVSEYLHIVDIFKMFFPKFRQFAKKIKK